MNNQPIPPNSIPSGGERPANFRPEDLQAVAPELSGQPARPETAPAPGGTPAPPQNTGQPAAPDGGQMSRDDVVAAIAAVPGPAGPSVPAAGAVPGAADDVDVIEPQWVSAAEARVQQTQGNPYEEEKAIEELNQDYLSKRYGYQVKNPNEEPKK